MVGVPRSNGCGLCIQRRVKCDLTRPACQNCSRYGVDCPGYRRERKFVTSKHQIRQRRPAPGQTLAHSTSEASTGTASGPVEYDFIQLTTAPDQRACRQTGSPITRDSPNGDAMHPLPIVLKPLRESRGFYINAMLENLNAGLRADELAFIYPWFKDIGQYVGAKVTLDSAVTSLILQMLGRRSQDDQMIGESHLLYGRSLQALQLALDSRTEWRTTETLCTTVLLCHFEMFAGTGGALSWMKHANALGLLVEKRGPEAYANEWDRSILNASRTAIIFNCFWSGRDCFFANPSWESVLRNSGSSQGLSPLEARRRALMNDYAIILAKLPGLMRRVYPLFESRLQGCLLPAYTQGPSTLGDHIDKMYRSLLLWSERMQTDIPSPTEITTSDETSPWPTVLAYENLWHGALYMGFWTVRLILQLGLELTRGKDATFEDSQVLVTNILRSCETVGEGIMGPYRIGFGIRCAYDVADAPTKAWIKSKLARIQKTSASLDASTFISPGEREAS